MKKVLLMILVVFIASCSNDDDNCRCVGVGVEAINYIYHCGDEDLTITDFTNIDEVIESSRKQCGHLYE